jgi:hypothetical protein
LEGERRSDGFKSHHKTCACKICNVTAAHVKNEEEAGKEVEMKKWSE